MKFELFIARKLQTGGDDSGSKSSSSILNIALIGMVLAVTIMILSLTIVNGFKSEITRKLYNLTPNIMVSSLQFNDAPTSEHSVDLSLLKNLFADIDAIKSMGAVSDKPAVLKTTSDFKGITLRGIDSYSNSEFLSTLIFDGTLPQVTDSLNFNEIAVSKSVADKLNLKSGDKVLSYFIDDNVRVRNLIISGVFNSDFEDFDDNFAICSAHLIRQLNGWDDNRASSLAIFVKNNSEIQDCTYEVYSKLTDYCVSNKLPLNYSVVNAETEYSSFFSWLKLLDTNIVIILALMALVAGFTLIAGLLIIILGRIRTIGLLKSLGASNRSVRMVFILLTQKLIIKALLIGNVLGLGFSFLQQQLHLIKLDASAYYMSFVPINIDWVQIMILNLCILVVAYLTLILPSYIVATITPAKTLHYE